MADNPKTTLLSPARLTLCILIKRFLCGRGKSQTNLSKEAMRELRSMIFHDIREFEHWKGCEMIDVLTQLQKVSSLEGEEIVKALIEEIEQIDSPDDIFDLFSSLEKLLQPQESEDLDSMQASHIDNRGIVGIFLQSSVQAFESLMFEGISQLFDDLNKWKERFYCNRGEGESNFEQAKANVDTLNEAIFLGNHGDSREKSKILSDYSEPHYTWESLDREQFDVTAIHSLYQLCDQSLQALVENVRIQDSNSNSDSEKNIANSNRVPLQFAALAMASSHLRLGLGSRVAISLQEAARLAQEMADDKTALQVRSHLCQLQQLSSVEFDPFVLQKQLREIMKMSKKLALPELYADSILQLVQCLLISPSSTSQNCIYATQSGSKSAISYVLEDLRQGIDHGNENKESQRLAHHAHQRQKQHEAAMKVGGPVSWKLLDLAHDSRCGRGSLVEATAWEIAGEFSMAEAAVMRCIQSNRSNNAYLHSKQLELAWLKLIDYCIMKQGPLAAINLIFRQVASRFPLLGNASWHNKLTSIVYKLQTQSLDIHNVHRLENMLFASLINWRAQSRDVLSANVLDTCICVALKLKKIGHWRQAYRIFQAAIPFCHRHNNMVLLAEIMLNLSYIVADATSDGGLVIPYIIQCLKLCDRISADWVKIRARTLLAMINLRLGSTNECLLQLEIVAKHNAMQYSAELGAQVCVLRAKALMLNLASQNNSKTDQTDDIIQKILIQSLKSFEEAERLYSSLYMNSELLDTLYWQALIYHRLGEVVDRNRKAFQYKVLSAKLNSDYQKHSSPKCHAMPLTSHIAETAVSFVVGC